MGGMLGAHAGAVKRQMDRGKWTGEWTRRISTHDPSRRRHDGAVAGLRHRAQKGLQMLGDNLMEIMTRRVPVRARRYRV
jgi:hypothetical protein